MSQYRPPPPTPGRRRAPRSFASALGLTVLGALVPGSAFLAAGRRRLGAATLLVFLALVGTGVWLATGGRRTLVRSAVDADLLLWAVGVLGVLFVLWVAVVVAGYRMLLPRPASRGRRVAGALVVAVIVLLAAAPAAWAGRLAVTQRDLIEGLFAEDGESATVVDSPDPFGDKERVNVLLLGGDGGEGREGVRTDTVIVASVDTETGDTVLFSLPRNLENLPFPEGSPLHEVYPDGFWAGSESESLLNAVYRNGPAEHPDILGPTDHPGADFLKLGVGEALGLTIDYFVLVNLDGFSELVDALGGITVNVNYWVPVGGIPDQQLPDDYIEPGPDREMDGPTALAFARGRYGLTDYDRMARQRCTIDAIIDAADPVTLLREYQDLAETTQDIVSTDIPRRALEDFVDLAFLVQEAEVRSVVFDASLIDPAYPDYDLMRQIVEEAIDPAASSGSSSAASDDSPATETSSAPPTRDGASEPPTGGSDPAADVGDACAYDEAQAEEQLEAGKPPTKGGD